jgi:hypothetical protein
MSSRIVDLRFWKVAGREPAPALQVAEYERAAIHEGVPIGQLVAALACRGLTVSNVPGLGVVIHLIGQDPCLPARRP